MRHGSLTHFVRGTRRWRLFPPLVHPPLIVRRTRPDDCARESKLRSSCLRAVADASVMAALHWEDVLIPGSFEYHRPASLSEAVALLGRLDSDARLIAGGHSLIPMMKLRLAMPTHLVDLAGVAELKGVVSRAARSSSAR